MRDPVTLAFDEDESLPTLVTRLAADTRALVGAEIAVYKARLGSKVAAYKTAALLFAVAGTLALAALIALLVGLILTLTPRVGPGVATAIVVGVVLVLAIILGLVGKAKLGGSDPTS